MVDTLMLAHASGVGEGQGITRYIALENLYTVVAVVPSISDGFGIWMQAVVAEPRVLVGCRIVIEVVACRIVSSLPLRQLLSTQLTFCVFLSSFSCAFSRTLVGMGKLLWAPAAEGDIPEPKPQVTGSGRRVTDSDVHHMDAVTESSTVC